MNQTNRDRCSRTRHSTGWVSRIRFGGPMYLEGDPLGEDATIEEQVGQVRDRIALLLEDGLAHRQGWFS